MESTGNKLLVFQFVNLYYTNFYGMMMKIHHFLEEYHSLIFEDGRYYYNLEADHIKFHNEIIIGDHLPEFIEAPIIFNYEMDESTRVNSLSKKIYDDLLKFHQEALGGSEERLVVQITHLLTNNQ
jgi:hypothetical protein